MFDFDVLVVGCGLSGATVARVLAEKGYHVKIQERRNHIGGNMYDYVDKHNILVHKYGPHTFHTNDKVLFDFMNKYSDWEEYKLTCGAEINGICTPTPFNYQTIDDFYSDEKAEKLKKRLENAFPNRTTITVVEALNCADNIVKEYAQFLFDNDYSLYTSKQWGVSPSEIDVSVLKRVPIRLGYETGYFEDKYQVMPKTSYTDFFVSILDNRNIKVELNVDALDYIVLNSDNKLIIDNKTFDGAIVYTGALDALFGYKYGQLPYRSLKFVWNNEKIKSKQDMPVVAYPQEEGFTRIVEYNKLPVQVTESTTYAVEYPLQYDPKKNQEPYYPVLTSKSKEQYKKYLSLSKGTDNLFLCGRLADFKYYNMDQALKKALKVSEQILEFLYNKK